jgi:NAD+ kinase
MITMREASAPPRRIAIGIHPEMDEAVDLCEDVSLFLALHGVKPLLCAPLNNEELRVQIQQGDFDLLIVLGGDGTMLRAGRLCAPHNIPVLGINLGHFGFLMELHGTQWKEALPKILQGSYHLEDRMMLRAEHWRNGSMMGYWDVMNEVVVCRGQYVRPVHLRAEVDGYLLTNFVADGLITATPTGSTAYALAAGGPILPPELRNILIVPVAPHLTVDHAMILSEGATVKVMVYSSHDAVMSVDGHYPVDMLDGDYVEIRAAKNVATFVRLQDPGYFYRNLMRYMEQNPSTSGIL